MTDAREERLPKWARQELATLRMRLAEAQSRERDNAEGFPEGVVFVRPYGEQPHPVARAGEAVMFLTGTGKLMARVNTREGNRVLEVSAYDGRLAVFPGAANVVTLEVRS